MIKVFSKIFELKTKFYIKDLLIYKLHLDIIRNQNLNLNIYKY